MELERSCVRSMRYSRNLWKVLKRIGRRSENDEARKNCGGNITTPIFLLLLNLRWARGVKGGICSESHNPATIPHPSTYVQRSPLFCANTFKKDPGRARQTSLATAGTNFTKPGAHNKGDLCTANQSQVEQPIQMLA